MISGESSALTGKGKSSLSEDPFLAQTFQQNMVKSKHKSRFSKIEIIILLDKRYLILISENESSARKSHDINRKT